MCILAKKQTRDFYKYNCNNDPLEEIYDKTTSNEYHPVNVFEIAKEVSLENCYSKLDLTQE